MKNNALNIDSQKEAIDKKQIYSDRIHELCKYIGFGILFLSLVEEKKYGNGKNIILLLASTFGIFTIMCEYLNTIVCYIIYRTAQKDIENKFQPKNTELSTFFFVIKQFFAMTGCFLILIYYIEKYYV